MENINDFKSFLALPIYDDQENTIVDIDRDVLLPETVRLIKAFAYKCEDEGNPNFNFYCAEEIMSNVEYSLAEDEKVSPEAEYELNNLEKTMMVSHNAVWFRMIGEDQEEGND